jgi:uncharacterized membrane protein
MIKKSEANQMKKTILLISVVLLLLVGALFLFLGKSSIARDAIQNSDEIITISLTEISENAEWYEYALNGVNIKYFAVEAKDGTINTAFDACDICYGNKKGYRQQGDVMVCNNCGNKYPISGLGTENLLGGGCWPGYLPSKIEGDNLIIKISDLKKGAYRFK